MKKMYHLGNCTTCQVIIKETAIDTLRQTEGDKFIMQYIGGIDDNTQDANGVTKRYIEDAVNSLLSGKPVVVNLTKSVGCAIKWKGV